MAAVRWVNRFSLATHAVRNTLHCDRSITYKHWCAHFNSSFSLLLSFRQQCVLPPHTSEIHFCSIKLHVCKCFSSFHCAALACITEILYCTQKQIRIIFTKISSSWYYYAILSYLTVVFGRSNNEEYPQHGITVEL